MTVRDSGNNLLKGTEIVYDAYTNPREIYRIDPENPSSRQLIKRLVYAYAAPFNDNAHPWLVKKVYDVFNNDNSALSYTYDKHCM
ncbi:MAG: hypothetical protein A2096_04765 [Spirochaetes bacterium GWF1_41_5]|nr:MAG: hypothetical protein A2096_04765 [Spirochaetes bacterium GWF1_41_5]HBE03002.1 hypothetical protein [Spirochaetia bacterium]